MSESTEPPSLIPRGPTAPGADETLVASSSGAEPRLPAAMLERGRAIGRYIVLRTLGRGGMGVVYQAYDPQLDRSVAIKLLLASPGDQGTQGRQRLVREAQAMARISHPNVIAVHDVGTIGDRVFFAMEYVEGQDLGAWLEAQPRSAAEILDVFLQAGQGMVAAHEAGLVHRDFKPSNVLVDERGRARVLDFGLARRGAEQDATEADAPSASFSNHLAIDLTKTGAVMGTPAYMAPEQFAGAQTDARTDQFSYGVALYEALAGERPFAGKTVPALSAHVLAGELRRDERPESIPVHVWTAIRQALSREPSDRFPSMARLLVALQRQPQRRGRSWIAGGAVVLALGAAAYWEREPVTPDPCADADASVSQIWGPVRTEAVRDAFAATGKSYAASTADRVVQRLDAYARAWSEGVMNACRDTRVEGTRDEVLLSKANDCFAERLRPLRALIDVLITANADTVLRSVRLVMELEDLTECTERDLLEVRVPQPTDPEVREQVRLLAAIQAEAAAALARGDAQACVDDLDLLQDEMMAQPYLPAQARFLVLRQECEWGLGRKEEGAKTELRAFERALAAGDDLTAIKIAANIAHRQIMSTDDLDEGEAWLLRAEALNTRHGLDSPRLIAPQLNVRGVLLARRGDVEGAVQQFARIRDISQGLEGMDATRLAGLQNMGVALANDHQSDRARAVFEQVAEESAAIWGPDHPRAALSWAKLAKLQLQEGEYAEAAKLLEASLKVSRQHRTPVSIQTAYDLHALGIAKRQLGEADEALRLYEESLSIRDAADAVNTSEAVEMLVTLAELYRDRGRRDEARGLLERSLKIRREADVDPSELGEVAIAYARLEQDEGDRAEAVRWATEAIRQAENGSATHRARPAEVILQGAAVLQKAGESEARKWFERGAALADEDDDAVVVGASLLEFARSLADGGERALALGVVGRVEKRLDGAGRGTEYLDAARVLRAELER